jgi:holin|nr:MAG TPA: holin [Bacteriophage sp.]
MKMSNKVYDVLKWISMVVIPSFITMLGTILSVLKVANTNVILIIIGAVATCLGSILKKSNMDYMKREENKSEDENV